MDDDLRKTVLALAEYDMNMTEAAKRLYVHRNTLVYRAKKIKEQYGLSVYRFYDLVELIYIANTTDNEDPVLKMHFLSSVERKENKNENNRMGAP